MNKYLIFLVEICLKCVCECFQDKKLSWYSAVKVTINNRAGFTSKSNCNIMFLL